MLGVLHAIVADGSMDRLATLVIGLATAGKIPYWAGYEETATPDDAWSETDLETDDED